MMSTKKGRPTDNPKGIPIHVRLDQKCHDILSQYTKQEDITIAEGIRRGIVKLEKDIKK